MPGNFCTRIRDNCLTVPNLPYYYLISIFASKSNTMFGLGTPEIILILAVVLVLFGGKKIPELMRGLGQGVREFNAAKSNIRNEIEEGMKEKPTQVPPSDTAK